VIVDEAQDHSAVALRVIGRRSPSGSMTLVGDVAQSTTPAGQERWSAVFDHLVVRDRPDGTVADLTIGYRVPEPILTVANRLLPYTGVDATASRSVRSEGDGPSWHIVEGDESLHARVAAVVREVKHRHKLTGVVAPPELRDPIAASLARSGLIAVDHVHALGHDDIPLFSAEAVKGLEFDGVVVVNPHEILDADGENPSRGARLLYVAMTRAVQELAFVTDAPPPELIA
jgi:DNA helicase IV